MKAKTTHHCHVIFVWHNTHTWRGFVVYWHDVSANTSKSCSFFLDYIHYHFKTVHQRNKKSASRTMISYLPIKHILDCKAFLFFNTVYPSLLKCLINKMKPFMALMSHSTKLINKPWQTPSYRVSSFPTVWFLLNIVAWLFLFPSRQSLLDPTKNQCYWSPRR